MVGPDGHGPRPIPSVQGRRRESVRRRAGCRREGPDVSRRSPEGLSLRGPAEGPGPLRRGLLQEPPSDSRNLGHACGHRGPCESRHPAHRDGPRRPAPPPGDRPACPQGRRDRPDGPEGAHALPDWKPLYGRDATGEPPVRSAPQRRLAGRGEAPAEGAGRQGPVAHPVPMADRTDLVRPELTLIADRSKEVDAIKASVARSQIAQHGEPYQRGPQSSTFWVHCPSCFRRTRQPWRPGTPVEFVCPTCANRAILAGEGAWDWVMPDIVGYEVALFRLGLGGWVVGSHAPYHPVIEQAYSRLFRCEMPPKFFLTSVPMFRGMGDPAGGYGRTRLLRALLEMEPSALAAALSSPWSDNPKIHSDLLRFPEVPSMGHQESIYQKT